MFTAHGIIRVYDTASDTCTVELTGIGAIDTWLSGVKVDRSIPRSQLISGAFASLALPDAHHLCEAIIAAVTGALPMVSSTLTQSGAKTDGFTDNSGNGTVTVTFATAYSAIPNVNVKSPQAGVSIFSVATTNFVVKIAGYSANSPWSFTWDSSGPK